MQQQTMKQFVLAQPAKLSTPEIIERGRARGYELQAGYVHSIRSLARKASSAKEDYARKVEAAKETRPARVRVKSLDDVEVELVELILTVGLVRTGELYENLLRTRNSITGNA